MSGAALTYKGVVKEFIGKVDPDLGVLRMSEFELVFYLANLVKIR